jgi:hypothetical protein
MIGRLERREAREFERDPHRTEDVGGAQVERLAGLDETLM